MKPKPLNSALHNAIDQSRGKRKTGTLQQSNNYSTANELSEIWLDKQDVLMLMHISSSTLQKWRKTGLPFSRVFGKIYYNKKDLLDFLDNNRHTNTGYLTLKP